LIDFYPGVVFQAAFGHHQMDVGFEAQVAPKGVNGVDHAEAQVQIQVSEHLADRQRCRFQEDLQERAVGVEEGAQEVIGGEGDVEMGDFEQVLGDVVDPVVDADFATGGAEAGLTREGHAVLILTARTDVAGVAAIGVAAEEQALDDLADVGALVGGDFVFQAQVTPAIPVIEEDLAEAVVAVQRGYLLT
jgi:hypothetical protein